MKRFSFAQFRFVIAAIVLTAAVAKAWQLATTPPLGEVLLHARWFNILVVEFELLFGTWLIFGLLPKLTRLATIGCFSVFAAVSLYKALSREVSCGCFGAIAVNPWLTMCFDMIIVALLVIFRPTKSETLKSRGCSAAQPSGEQQKILVILLIWLLFSIPATYMMLSVKEADTGDDLGVVFTGLDGKEKFLITPDKWLGKELPLMPHLETTEALERIKQGEWLVLLYHNDCDKCEKTIRELTENQGVDVICVEIPPVATVRKCPEQFEYARMKTTRIWMADTPIVVKMDDLVVKEIVGTLNESK